MLRSSIGEVLSEALMFFMVIERFKDRDAVPVYKRVRDQGVNFPEGLTYHGS